LDPPGPPPPQPERITAVASKLILNGIYIV
jgi:hypothetical protein